MEILLIMGIIVCALYLFSICGKLKKEINRHISDYNLLVSDYEYLTKENSDLINENTQIRKEIEKVKGENQDLVQIILKYHEK